MWRRKRLPLVDGSACRYETARVRVIANFVVLKAQKSTNGRGKTLAFHHTRIVPISLLLLLSSLSTFSSHPSSELLLHS
jgi:hypothetical protein